MRVFLDTNVLVSAFATRGLCADVLRIVLAEHALVTSNLVIRELRRVLRTRIKLPVQTVAEIETFLQEYLAGADPDLPSDLPIRDEDDRWILASAIAGAADVLVTGDRDLLDVAAKASIRIVSPRCFWDLVRRS